MGQEIARDVMLLIGLFCGGLFGLAFLIVVILACRARSKRDGWEERSFFVSDYKGD